MKSHIIANSQPPPSAKPDTENHIAEGPVLHLLDVGAGGKRLLRARQYHRANAGIGLTDAKNLIQLGNQLRVDRV
jgi:hypothetical protein